MLLNSKINRYRETLSRTGTQDICMGGRLQPVDYIPTTTLPLMKATVH